MRTRFVLAKAWCYSSSRPAGGFLSRLSTEPLGVRCALAKHDRQDNLNEPHHSYSLVKAKRADIYRVSVGHTAEWQDRFRMAIRPAAIPVGHRMLDHGPRHVQSRTVIPRIRTPAWMKH